MKCKILRAGFAVIFASGLIMSVVAPAHAWDRPCSMARSAGNYGFTDSGTVVGIGPRIAVGAFNLDGAGKLQDGVATSSLNGSIAQETFSGTYAVSDDCTGTINVKIYSGGTELFAVTLNISFDDDMKQVRGIFTSAVTPSGAALATVIGLEGRKQ
jgi:hypothetical protein